MIVHVDSKILVISNNRDQPLHAKNKNVFRPQLVATLSWFEDISNLHYNYIYFTITDKQVE